MKRAAFASAVALMLIAVGTLPAHADMQPTPPAVRDLTPASATAPTAVIVDVPGSTCSGWYLQKEYAESWPAATTWWEQQCGAWDPPCWPQCETTDPDPPYIVNLYYWDGSAPLYYGQHIYMGHNSGTGCQYWQDAATGLEYQYDIPTCPWAGPGNAAPYPDWRLTCSAVYDCTFDASNSFASDGIAVYLWDFGDGTTGQGATAEHIYAALGTYPVTLTLTDNGGLQAQTAGSVRIDVPPAANFTYTCSGWRCTFDGTASFDPDGAVQHYSWNFGDGTPGARGAIAQHAYWTAGTYTATLWVDDDAGFSAMAQQTVVISGPNPDVPPIASFAYDCLGLSCWFDPTASRDPDGTIIEYDWAYTDANGVVRSAGYTYTPSMMYLNFPNSGPWTVTLTVTDDGGLKGSTSQTLVSGDIPPRAAITSTCSALACSFDGSASADADGTIASYSWNFGDGSPPATTAIAQHRYANVGTYNVTLSVTDNVGLAGNSSQTVTVLITSPTASFTATCAGGACTFDASTSSDVGGTLVSYSWNFGDGTSGLGKVVQHTYAAGRTYTVTLTVTDSGDVSASAARTASAMSLTVTTSRVKNQRFASLVWAGSSATVFDLYRNGVRIATVSGTSYTDTLSKAGAYTYQVCESGSTSMCSSPIAVSV